MTQQQRSSVRGGVIILFILQFIFAPLPPLFPTPVAEAQSAPMVNSYSFSPAVVSPGERTVLSWDIGNVNNVWIAGIGGMPNPSSIALTPNQSTSYTLYAGSGTNTLSTTTAVTVVPCQYSFSPSSTSISIPSTGGSGGITVTTSPGCYVQVDTAGTVLYNTQWFSVALGGMGTRTIGYSAIANTNTVPRSATITINGRTYTVDQPDGVLRATFTADTTSVRPGEPAHLSWTTTNANVIRIDQGVGTFSGGNGGFIVTPTSPTTYTLTATSAAGDTVTSSVTVNVLPCSYAVTPPTNTTLDSGGGPRDIQVATSPLCEWHASDFWNTFGTAQPGPWPNNIRRTLTGTPWGNGLMRGNGTVTYDFPPNSGLPSRSASATVAGESFSFSQTGEPIPTASLASECVSLLDTPPGQFVTYEDVLTMINRAQGIQAPSTTTLFKYGLSLAELDSIYQTLKNGSGAPYVTTGATGVYPDGWDERFTPLARLACNGMVRTPVDGNLDYVLSQNNYGDLWRAWSTAEALTHGFRDIAPDDYRRQSQIPHRFLAPSYVAGTAVGSCLGFSGSPRTVAFYPGELFTAIPFITLENDLGYAPSGTMTLGLYDDAQCVRLAPALNLVSPSTPTPIPNPPPTSPAPAPTASLYSQTIKTTYANFNWQDSYAWKWKPTTSGIPTQFTISVKRVVGKPVGNFCVRSLQARTSAALGCAMGVKLVAGDNVIPLTGGLGVAAGLTYYVHFTRTSNSSNYPSFYYRSPGTFRTYRSTASNVDPTILWFKGDIAMKVEGFPIPSLTPSTTPSTATPPPPSSPQELFDLLRGAVLAKANSVSPFLPASTVTAGSTLSLPPPPPAPTIYADSNWANIYTIKTPTFVAIGNQIDPVASSIIGDAVRDNCQQGVTWYNTGLNLFRCAGSLFGGVLYGAFVRPIVSGTADAISVVYTGKHSNGAVATSNGEFFVATFDIILSGVTVGVSAPVKQIVKVFIPKTQYFDLPSIEAEISEALLAAYEASRELVDE